MWTLLAQQNNGDRPWPVSLKIKGEMHELSSKPFTIEPER